MSLADKEEIAALAAWTVRLVRRQRRTLGPVTPPLKLDGAKLSSTAFGPAGAAAIVLNGNRAQTITGPGAAWRSLPALPAATATLAPGPAGGFDALAVPRTTLTIWRLAAGSATWHTTQAINVPIQFGSSG